MTTQPPKNAPADATFKICPNCGDEFPAGGRGLGKVFCSAPCRSAFNQRMKAEGAVMAAIVKAWHLGRHAKPDTVEAEVCSYARTQLAEIARVMNDADRDAGRPSAILYVQSLMESGTLYVDRRRG